MIKNTKQATVGRNYSRRDFIQTSSIAVGALGASIASNNVLAKESISFQEGSTRVRLNVSGYNFSRVAALIDGSVNIEGCETRFEEGKIGDLNTHVFSGPQTLDVAEIGLHPFMLAYANGNFRDYSLLPIFPLRLFRHKSIFIRTDRGIHGPEDLRGKTVGTAGYSSTSLTWLRGIFQHEYGIKPEELKWVIAADDSSADMAGKVSSQESVLPDGVPITTGTRGKDESELLESGEVDLLFHAAEPRAYIEGHPKIARLFPDYRATERAYFAKTGIFPIMHAVAIKKATSKRHPWLAMAVCRAYSQAKLIAFQNMAKSGWFNDSLPWYGQEFEETQSLMGANYYSYGIEPNRKTLEALFRYSHEQGLSSRTLNVEELFDPRSLEFAESAPA
jgi:4,5-dihydroxyphthalate decarboxylase